MNRKQMLLHTAISYFIFYMDTLQKGNYTHEEKLRMIKNSVNKTNLSCRAALFDVHDAEQIRELNDFIIVDEKKPENRIFECLQEKEIPVQCFDKIKHQALYIEKIILEKNFKKLNL